MTIRRKLITIQLITAASVLLFGSAVFVWNDLQTFRSSLVSQLGSSAELIGENTASSLLFLDSDTASQILGSLSVSEEITHACLYDPSGAIFATYVRPGFPGSNFSETPGQGNFLARIFSSSTSQSGEKESWSARSISDRVSLLLQRKRENSLPPHRSS